MPKGPPPPSRRLSKKSPTEAREAQEGPPGGRSTVVGRGRDALGPKVKPVIRRVWAPIGKRPVARFKRGYKWTYLYGFVRPESGQVFWMILPTVNTELFSLALGEFAKEVGAGTDKHILLVLDKAGWHTGATTRREVVAANQRGVGQRALRGDRRDRANADGPMRGTARSKRADKGPHQLPLVAAGCMMFRELFSRTRY